MVYCHAVRAAGSFFEAARLLGPHARVRRVRLAQQGGVRALLDEQAVLHDEDEVGSTTVCSLCATITVVTFLLAALITSTTERSMSGSSALVASSVSSSPGRRLGDFHSPHPMLEISETLYSLIVRLLAS